MNEGRKLFNYMSMNEVIKEGIIDTNKERNLLSSDPIFVSKFRKEWDEITNKLKEKCSKSKGQKKEIKNESIRYSASAIEFR